MSTPSAFITDYDSDVLFIGRAERAAEITECMARPMPDHVAMGMLTTISGNRFGVLYDEMTALTASLMFPGIRDHVASQIIRFDYAEGALRAALAGAVDSEINWSRVNRFEIALVHLLEWTPDEMRGTLFSLLAFIHWYKGNGPAAAEFAERAQDCGDESALPQIILDALADETFPAVVANPAASYRGTIGSAWSATAAGL